MPLIAMTREMGSLGKDVAAGVAARTGKRVVYHEIIEPMINAGRAAIRALADGWTIVTADHSLSAQWEHTVLVTEEGYEVLTVSAGTPAVPAFVAQRTERPVAG